MILSFPSFWKSIHIPTQKRKKEWQFVRHFSVLIGISKEMTSCHTMFNNSFYVSISHVSNGEYFLSKVDVKCQQFIQQTYVNFLVSKHWHWTLVMTLCHGLLDHMWCGSHYYKKHYKHYVVLNRRGGVAIMQFEVIFALNIMSCLADHCSRWWWNVCDHAKVRSVLELMGFGVEEMTKGVNVENSVKYLLDSKCTLSIDSKRHREGRPLFRYCY